VATHRLSAGVRPRWKDSAGQEPTIPKEFPYVYKYQAVSQIE
jgi:hypothetical protein